MMGVSERGNEEVVDTGEPVESARSMATLDERVASVLDRKVFFVVGAPKSGTTWLQRLLDGHPQLHCSGEGHFFTVFAGELNALCKKFNQFRRRNDVEVYEGESYYDEMDEASTIYLTRTMAALLLSQRDIAPEVVWVGDKTPGHGLALEQLRVAFPAAVILNIVRDGRDTAVSGLHHAVRSAVAQGQREARRPAMADSVETLAKRWVDFVAAPARYGEEHPGVVHTVRYEDLLVDPHGNLAEICERLGVSSEPAAVDRAVDGSSFERLSGGRQPGQEDADSFVRKGVAGDWRSQFDAESLAVFENIAGDWLTRYGYEVGVPLAL